MIKIKINKDISDYSEGLFYGLTMKEILRLIIAAVVSIIFIWIFSYIMPLFFAVYMCMPVVAIILFAGKKIGNMTVKEIMAYYPVYKRMKKGIYYNSTENINVLNLKNSYGKRKEHNEKKSKV